MVESGEITKEEAWDVLEELTNMKGRGNFMTFMSELQAKLNCKVIRGTQTYLEIEEGFD
jgi:polyhydroxyalkanoate synthesis regulator phasin